jgi:hypothetical protein
MGKGGIHYYSVDQVQVKPFTLQGTVYPKLEDAKHAALALKLYCNTTGVLVKRVRDGWTLLWWRQQTVL